MDVGVCDALPRFDLTPPPVNEPEVGQLALARGVNVQCPAGAFGAVPDNGVRILILTDAVIRILAALHLLTAALVNRR